MAVEDALDIFGSDPFGRDYLYGLSTGQERLGLQPPPQGLQLDTRPYDQMQATPRGFTSGLFSDLLGGTLNMPSMPRTGIPALDLLYMNRNPVLNMMGVGDVQKTAERISYGQPLTTGSGMTLKPREETIFAGMAVAPLVGEAVNLGTRAGRAGARIVGERIAENVAMGRPNLPSMLAEPRSSLFAVEPSALMLKPQAPVSELGFYSAAEQAALNLPRNKGTGQSFLNDLMKAPDVKKDELSWIGLDDFLKDKPNVTKQEVQDFIASNKIDLQEVRLGGNEQPSQDLLNWMSARNISQPRNPEGWQELSQKLESFAQQYQKAQGSPEATQRFFTLSEEAGRISEGLDAGGSSSGATKYDRYQLAGGENYREILLKMPNEWDKPRAAQNANDAKIKALRQEMHGTSGTDEIRSEISRLQNENIALQKQINEAPIYKSSHFDQPNILAHIRVNDRVDADGKKMLLVEELQSDWHQAGREKGYKGQFKDLPNDYKVQSKTDKDGYAYYEVLDPQGNVFAKDYSKGSVTNQAINRLNETVGGVPDAPFKDTWYQLSLKRILKYAADNGYERVGLTTGKQQIDRFSNELRQNVDEITFQTGLKLTPSEAAELQALRSQQTYMTGTERARYEYLSSNEGEYVGKNETKIKAFKGSKPTFSGTVKDGKFIDGQAQGKTVEEVLGKTMAKQIAEKQTGVIKGDNLTVGGEGMKAYYDEIYPKFLEKYGKKWDAGVGETKVRTNEVPYIDYVVTKTPFSDFTVVGVKPDGSKTIINQNANSIEEAQKLATRYKDKNLKSGEPIRYIDITPKMKEGVKKGQPLAAAEQTPEMLASGGLDYADPFRNPLLESSIG